jgi:predicted amidohydrolase YtcJ
VLIDADPRMVPPDEVEHIAVLETWMNGNRVNAA